jgi:hypothetical protein
MMLLLLLLPPQHTSPQTAPAPHQSLILPSRYGTVRLVHAVSFATCRYCSTLTNRQSCNMFKRSMCCSTRMQSRLLLELLQLILIATFIHLYEE